MELNDSQKEIKFFEGNLMVVAGPGSGKTHTMIEKIKYMIIDRKIRPTDMLVLTFTRKAAGELVARLEKNEIFGLKASTFHSYCADFVLKNKSDFKICSDKDRENIFNSLSLSKKEIEFINDKKRGLPVSGNAEMRHAFKSYETEMKERKLLGFDDILLEFLKDDNIKPDKKFVIVDEFQDTSIVQYKVLKKITEKSEWTCCVGDDNQSIYGFNGANMENMGIFVKEYNATIMTLEKNYRSLSAICECSNKLMEHASKKIFNKTIAPVKDGGGIIEFFSSDSVSGFINKYINDNKKELGRTAVICRTNNDIFKIRSKLSSEILKKPFLYKISEHIESCYAAKDWDIKNFVDIYFSEVDFLGKTPGSEEELLNCKRISKEKISEIYSVIVSNDAVDIFKIISNKNGMFLGEDFKIFEMWDKKISKEGKSNLECFYEILAISEKVFSNKNSDKVEVLTAHASKGLEFETVIIPYFNKKSWPNSSSEDWKFLDEERRVFYVAITRSEKRLVFVKDENQEDSIFEKELV